MPLMDYATYLAGYMPRHDVTAQIRCFTYLQDVIKKLQDRGAAGDKFAKNEAAVFTDIKNMIDVASGSMRLDRATTFWKYWDKNKEAIISQGESTKDNYKIQDKIGELEEGRYFPN